jgi:radical SAM protein with 4Fe4S-binding SPASM domain
MLLNFIIGAAIFGYAAYALLRFFKKAKEGKCAGCDVKSSCQSSCGKEDYLS